MHNSIIEFINGAVAMGCAISGLCFLKFWRQSKDRLFGLFAAAFFLMGVNRVVWLVSEDNGSSLIPYFVRLLGFIIIIAAIVDKNTRSG